IDQVRTGSVNLGINPVHRGEPAQLAWFGWIGMVAINPRRPKLQHPEACRRCRRIRGYDHPAALAWVARSVPPNDEPELAFEKIPSLVEVDQIVRIAFEPLLVALLLAAGKLDQAVAKFPALLLAVVAVAVSDDVFNALHQLDRVLVDAAQDQRSLMY